LAKVLQDEKTAIEGTMQHTITITIPETLESRIQGIGDFAAFVSVITVRALQYRNTQEQNQQLAEAVRLMLDEYTDDLELTSFTALDGESVYE
jgi:GAF domain-containing protein